MESILNKKNRGLIVGTGWCAFPDGRANNRQTFKGLYRSDHFNNIWIPHITKQISVEQIIIYQSNCPVKLDPPKEPNIYILNNIDNVKKQDHLHDCYSAMMAGAMVAYLNRRDYLYIEQDCLVFGLKKAVEWAKKSQSLISYGNGEFSYSPGWAEESFLYVSHEFLKRYIVGYFKTDVPNILHPCPETITTYHFEEYVSPWPFGYGRKRPDNLQKTVNEEEVFYMQQITEPEFEILWPRISGVINGRP
jgi:hypothetical protein